jgi:hypothetical protein
MAHKSTIKKLLRREPVGDILGGVWLVTLMLGLMNLPSLMA